MKYLAIPAGKSRKTFQVKLTGRLDPTATEFANWGTGRRRRELYYLVCNTKIVFHTPQTGTVCRALFRIDHPAELSARVASTSTALTFHSLTPVKYLPLIFPKLPLETLRTTAGNANFNTQNPRNGGIYNITAATRAEAPTMFERY